MRYVLREVHWEFDDSEYNECGLRGFGGVYATRQEAEAAKIELERTAYRDWLSWLLRLDSPNGRTYSPEAIYKFFVDRLGASTALLIEQPYTLPHVDDLSQEPAVADLDDLRNIIGAEFVRIVEIPDSTTTLFKVTLNPYYRSLGVPWVTGMDDWDLTDYFFERGTAIVHLLHQTFLYSGEIQLTGTIEELVTTPHIFGQLLASSAGIRFEENVLTLTDDASDDVLVSINAILRLPLAVLEEVGFDQAPPIESFGKNRRPLNSSRTSTVSPRKLTALSDLDRNSIRLKFPFSSLDCYGLENRAGALVRDYLLLRRPGTKFEWSNSRQSHLVDGMFFETHAVIIEAAESGGSDIVRCALSASLWVDHAARRLQWSFDRTADGIGNSFYDAILSGVQSWLEEHGDHLIALFTDA